MSRRRPAGRELTGIVLLDKPSGLSSNQALQQVKRLFRARKAGHTGSLDPLATGMLPICFGAATRISPFLLDADKSYRTVARLGEATDTGDAEGAVIRQCPVPAIDAAKIEKVLNRFRGEIEQVPPMYSALRHKGQRLYELARQGKTVERPARRVTIHRLELRAWCATELELDVRCSKGTYIRTLVEDIASALGCCAHVTLLRRTTVHPFEDQPMMTLERLQALAADGPAILDGALLPTDAGLAHWPAVLLDEDETRRVLQGQTVARSELPGAPWIRMYSSDREFLGIAQGKGGRLAPKRLFAKPV